jgi:release factor glutamine methyltransferase
LLPLPGVFQPHSDSWLLAACLAREPLGPDTSVLDLCAGSGVLAVTAAIHGAASVTAVDVSRRAIAAIRLNARLNGVRVRAVRSDLFSALARRRFDVIVSNPPYLPGQADHLPRRGAARAWEAGRSGRAFIDRICAQAREHLNPAGVLLLAHSSVCGEQATLDALRAAGLSPHVVARRRGPLGPRLRARSEWLRDEGLLLDDDEQLVVIRAQPDGQSGPPRRTASAGSLSYGLG